MTTDKNVSTECLRYLLVSNNQFINQRRRTLVCFTRETPLAMIFGFLRGLNNSLLILEGMIAPILESNALIRM